MQPEGITVASVVIPAHNEESVIVRCLTTLLDGAAEGEFEVVVAANGCTDATVDRVRGSGLPVKCIEVEPSGKIAALNAADGVCETYPRIYLDADVVLTSTAARELALVLAQGEILAGAPRMAIDSSSCSAAVRAYYRVWTRQRVFANGYVGSGVYGLSRAGHKRVAPFPAVTNDDYYVQRSFADHERRTTPGSFTVFPARTVAALARRSARTRAGNRELDSDLGSTGVLDTSRGATIHHGGSGLAALARDPRNWTDLLVFVLVTVRIRVAAARRRRSGDAEWGRDDSSRESDQ